MKLSEYLEKIKPLYLLQRKEIKKDKRCIGWNGGVFVYESVEQYDNYVKEFVVKAIDKGSVENDLENQSILDFLQKKESSINLMEAK